MPWIRPAGGNRRLAFGQLRSSGDRSTAGRVCTAGTVCRVSLPRFRSTAGRQPRRPGDARCRAETVAVYDDATRTIYLAEGWSGATRAELSVLVHEMVHHLQSRAQLDTSALRSGKAGLCGTIAGSACSTARSLANLRSIRSPCGPHQMPGLSDSTGCATPHSSFGPKQTCSDVCLDVRFWGIFKGRHRKSCSLSLKERFSYRLGASLTLSNVN